MSLSTAPKSNDAATPVDKQIVYPDHTATDTLTNQPHWHFPVPPVVQSR